MTDHTPTPWRWVAHDGSVLALEGLDEAHVLWSGICPACQESGGRCTAPSDANAEHIVRCVNAHDDLVEALEAAHRRLEEVLAGISTEGSMTVPDELTTRIHHETRELRERVVFLEGATTGLRGVVDRHTETLEQMAETMRLIAEKSVGGKHG